MAWNFLGSSKVAALSRKTDWSNSVLGHPNSWPLSLQSVVRLILTSKFPMCVAWGPELGFLYNDAYAEILGSKHPHALGARFQDIWPEIWTELSPIVDSALQGESRYFEDLPLVVERAGNSEQGWFTFSCSPLHDDHGVIAGMYCTVVETTRIVKDRTLRQFQLNLADTLHPLTTSDEVVATAVEMLGNHLSASGCWYAEIDDAAGIFHTQCGWFEPSAPVLPQSGKIDAFSPALLTTLRTGKAFVSNDLTTDPRTRDFADRYLALGIRSILIMPILKDKRLLFNINVIKREAYLWAAEDIQAAKDVVDRTWVAMDNAITRQRLQTERDQSDYILNQMGEGFILIEHDGRIANLNAEGVRILQRPAVDVVGKSFTEIWNDDIGYKVAAACKEVADTGTATIFEINHQVCQPNESWLEMRISLLKAVGLVIFFRDVTAQKRSTLALRQSEEHLSALFEQTSAGIAERDLQGRLIRVNERLCEILGRPREAVLGVNIHDLTHPDDLPRSEAAFKKLLKDGQPFEIEKRYLQPDGRPVWVSTTVSLIRKVEGRPNSVLAIIADITKRKLTEQALQDETRILELLNQSGQALAETLDLNTLLQTVTDTGRALTGAEFGAFFYNGKDASGDAYLLYTLSGAPREAFERFGHPRATALFKPTFVGEPAIRSDDITKDPRYGKMAPHFGMPKGHLPVRSYLAAPVVSRSGEVIGGLFFGHSQVGVFTERSERLITGLAAQGAMAIDNARLYDLAQKAAEERQALLTSERAARAEAERLNRSKDEFLAMLAHELRNPLAPVSAATAVLRMAGNDPAKVRQVSEIISRQIGHFTHLIDDLMDVSRVTRGLIRLEVEPLDIKTIVHAAVEQVRPVIEARKHTLTTRIDADHTVVNGDRTRLVQVAANLLTNAAKFTPPHGEITLRVQADDSDAKIIVSDNGSGIDEALLPHVFDLFTQGKRGLDRGQGGLGIGLALVKAIVTLHEGEVQAVSGGPGKGSTFKVSIPLLHQAGVPCQEAESGPAESGHLSILVVDDNVDAANAIAILLMAVGHQVRVAPTAHDTLNKTNLHEFDVFILDIGLPDMTGYELVKALRRQPGLGNKTYIALTGYGQPQDRQLSKDAGFAHHFVKPVDNHELFKMLSDVESKNPRT
ncbi:PAS domain-containing protein [Noviherbaspirillum sp. 1P10PC]|uniref:PAS domain-containing protein n=1 Tax=Noviherbaspirillum sp. 1P10PC TaxID=3132292 RepID=UPI00399F6BBE